MHNFCILYVTTTTTAQFKYVISTYKYALCLIITHVKSYDDAATND